MVLQTLPVVLYLSSPRFCRDSGVRDTTTEVSFGATSTCPGIRVRPATTTAATTAKHALKSRACAPLSNSRETKGHAARSCHPLPDSLPSSTSFSSPLCPLPDHQSQSLSTPHLLRRQCRAAICHPGTRRCHPAGRLPYTAVMASGSPRKISNRQKGRRAGWRGRAEGQRAEDPLSYPGCPRLAAVRPSSPPFASPRFGRSLCTILQWINESF